jgi:serine protease Do/serine protease DegQ
MRRRLSLLLVVLALSTLYGAPGDARGIAPGQLASFPLPLGNDGKTPSHLYPLFRRFFGAPGSPGERELQGSGSGVIVDANEGTILTNHHVVARANEIQITLSDGRRLEGEFVGSDPESDVALVRVTADDLQSVPLGDSDALEVGDFVAAIGNPFGLRQTATLGIVSALGRNGLGIGGYEDYIQTDASINPGNSGGALVNMSGELVGINTAILAPSGGNVGIGFAIPINMAREIMRQIVEHGGVKRGRLGVVIQDLTPELAEAFEAEGQQGAVVSSVEPGSAAERAGLEPGDVILGLDGAPVRGSADLRNKVGLRRAGDTVQLEVWRDGERLSVTAGIGGVAVEQAAAARRVPALEGVVLAETPAAESTGEPVEGLAVVEVESGSRPWAAGLRPGDVIVAVNRVPVKTLENLEEAAKRDGDGILLRVRRGEGALFVYVS